MRPLALRSAGNEGSSTSAVRHVGRRSGRTYETPVIAVQHDDSFPIALPYGKRTDWLKNVLGKGSATIVTNGHAYEVDRPEVIPMAEATAYFRSKEQRMHRQFHVDSALQVRRVAGYAGLRTDKYPPFRLEVDRLDPGTPTLPPTAGPAVDVG
jgi:deazaflavin-dependent oxidoreductase (nitroreductase family)